MQTAPLMASSSGPYTVPMISARTPYSLPESSRCPILPPLLATPCHGLSPDPAQVISPNHVFIVASEPCLGHTTQGCEINL